MITKPANIYKKNTGVYPLRVMYFRDGVAEGQCAKVKNIEVATINDAIGTLSGRIPSVTALVVRKRNRAHLSPKDGKGDRSSKREHLCRHGR